MIYFQTKSDFFDTFLQSGSLCQATVDMLVVTSRDYYLVSRVTAIQTEKTKINDFGLPQRCASISCFARLDTESNVAVA